MAFYIFEDLKKKELLPIKIMMFLIYGGQATLYPFLAVHLESLGVSTINMAIIFAVQPIVALIALPSVGVLADKLGHIKILFCFFLCFSAISANCLLLAPPTTKHQPVLMFGVNSSCEDPGIQLQYVGHQHCDFKVDPSAMPKVMNVTLRCCNEQLVDGKEEKTKFCLYSSMDTHVCDLERRAKSFQFISNNTDKTEYDDYVFVFEDIAEKNCSCDEDSDPLSCTCVIYIRDNLGEMCDLPEIKPMRTFWIYLGIRLVVTLGIGMVNGLFDATSMVVIQKHGADVGLQRFWATAGMCAMAPVSGYLVDTTSIHSFEHDYSNSFYLYGALYGSAALVCLFIEISIKRTSSDTVKDLRKLLLNPEVAALLFFVLFLGICWGFLENFLFLFLQKELDADTLLMGLTVTVGSATGLPMAIASSWVTSKIGYVNVIIIAFFAYTIRFLGYSFAYSPYLCFVYESMENFTVTLMTIGVTMYCAHLAPLKMLTTMMTIWNSLHFITGRSLGSLVGGYLTDQIGRRRTFRVFAYLCAIMGTIYTVINIFYLSRRNQIKDDLEKATAAMGGGSADKRGMKAELKEKKKILDKELRYRAESLCNSVINFREGSGMHTFNMISILATEGRRHTTASVQRTEDKDKSATVSYSRSFSPGTSPRRASSSFLRSLSTVEEETNSVPIETRHRSKSLNAHTTDGIDNFAFNDDDVIEETHF